MNDVKPGRYEGVSKDDYDQAPGVRSTYLGWAADSIETLDWNLSHPQEQKDYFDVGDGCHHLILLPEVFDEQFVCGPECRRGTKQWNEFTEANQGKTILRKEDYETIQIMRDKVFSHPRAKNLLREGSPEVSYWWEQDGEMCKCRVDWEPGDDVYVDLKTTTDASPRAVGKAMEKFGYHRQAGWYCTGVQAVTGVHPMAFIFIFIEKTPPYHVAVYHLDDFDLEIGECEALDALQKYLEWKQSPPEQRIQYPKIEKIYLPEWKRREWELAHGY